MTYLTPDSNLGFAGIEVKYHENLLGKAARNRTRYDEVAARMGCFRNERLVLLQEQPLQQIWRDHLLAGSLIAAKEFTDGFFVFLYPQQNDFCHQAVGQYVECLSDTSTFMRWTLEDVCESIVRNTTKEWISDFLDRYLNFKKLTHALEAEG